MSEIGDTGLNERKLSGNEEHEEEERIKSENKALKQKIMCIICKAEPRSVLFLGCKHLAVCEACHRDCTNCPLCDQRIKAFIDVVWA
ncbi:death-associated inhibitor of apoptosis 2-like [Mercenaria mercenaria]|uniref:death-associated inhibitor of apoptosis 2-like n=1 Tax=Mercenaria mercenaria TaxID=6596 RepID=UPI00234ECBB8|nr:death-associated inhibitor of apoptosis 2-like [Mercenaria mercenaria]